MNEVDKRALKETFKSMGEAIWNSISFLGWIYFFIFMIFAFSSTKIYMTNREDVIKEIQPVWDSSTDKPIQKGSGTRFNIQMGGK
jgi:hypothetical protein